MYIEDADVDHMSRSLYIRTSRDDIRIYTCTCIYRESARRRRPHVTISTDVHRVRDDIRIYTHTCIYIERERANVNHMSRDMRLECAVATCLATSVHHATLRIKAARQQRRRAQSGGACSPCSCSAGGGGRRRRHPRSPCSCS